MWALDKKSLNATNLVACCSTGKLLMMSASFDKRSPSSLAAAAAEPVTAKILLSPRLTASTTHEWYYIEMNSPSEMITNWTASEVLVR